MYLYAPDKIFQFDNFGELQRRFTAKNTECQFLKDRILILDSFGVTEEKIQQEIVAEKRYYIRSDKIKDFQLYEGQFYLMNNSGIWVEDVIN